MGYRGIGRPPNPSLREWGVGSWELGVAYELRVANEFLVVSCELTESYELRVTS